MEIKHGQVYVDNKVVGWATYIEEPFGHTLKALIYFLDPQHAQQWDSFELRIMVQVGDKRYLQCSNLKKTGAVTLDGKVWKEYLISFQEMTAQAAPPASSALSDTAQ